MNQTEILSMEEAKDWHVVGLVVQGNPKKIPIFLLFYYLLLRILLSFLFLLFHPKALLLMKKSARLLR